MCLKLKKKTDYEDMLILAAGFQVDSVRHMSWQAQIRGRKQWVLAPPSECLYMCNWITFTVSPGDICNHLFFNLALDFLK